MDKELKFEPFNGKKMVTGYINKLLLIRDNFLDSLGLSITIAPELETVEAMLEELETADTDAGVFKEGWSAGYNQALRDSNKSVVFGNGMYPDANNVIKMLNDALFTSQYSAGGKALLLCSIMELLYHGRIVPEPLNAETLKEIGKDRIYHHGFHAGVQYSEEKRKGIYNV